MINCVSEVKSTVLDTFGSLADFRQSKAEGRPWDLKNSNYAESLERVIAYIQSLPDDHHLFQKLGTCEDLYDPWAEMFKLPDDEGRDIVHCGSPNKPLTADEGAAWFIDWVEGVVAAAEERATEYMDANRFPLTSKKGLSLPQQKVSDADDFYNLCQLKEELMSEAQQQKFAELQKKLGKEGEFE